MRANVDPEKCIGCTLCTQVCPEVFKMDDDKSVAYMNPVPEEVKHACKEAADQCPVNAITIDENP